MSNRAIVLDANILVRALLGWRVRGLIIDYFEMVQFRIDFVEKIRQKLICVLKFIRNALVGIMPVLVIKRYGVQRIYLRLSQPEEGEPGAGHFKLRRSPPQRTSQ